MSHNPGIRYFPEPLIAAPRMGALPTDLMTDPEMTTFKPLRTVPQSTSTTFTFRILIEAEQRLEQTTRNARTFTTFRIAVSWDFDMESYVRAPVVRRPRLLL